MTHKQTKKNNNVAGKAGPGRPKGSLNKTTTLLKEAILKAAELSGEDGKGKGKTVGYLKRLANEQPVAFSGLLGKVLPMQVTGPEDVEGNYQEIRVSFVGSGSNPS